MAVSRADLSAKVDGFLAGNYETTKSRGVPTAGDVPHGNHAHTFEGTALFIDLRQSSDITNTFRQQTAAKMMKAYFYGAVQIIRSHDGHLRSFNGDGMLAMFVGGSQTTNAVKAAMRVETFVVDVLQPKFNRFFESRPAHEERLDFSTGCGIDRGQIYAVNVGIRGSNDIAWVGRATNTAAKLSDMLRFPHNIGVTTEAYSRLNSSEKNTSDGDTMWSGIKTETFGGVARKYRTTNYKGILT